MEYIELLILIDKLNSLITELSGDFKEYVHLEGIDAALMSLELDQQITVIEGKVEETLRFIRKNMNDVKRMIEEQEYFSIRSNLNEMKRELAAIREELFFFE
jgi:hypothetical protein